MTCGGRRGLIWGWLNTEFAVRKGIRMMMMMIDDDDDNEEEEER